MNIKSILTKYFRLNYNKVNHAPQFKPKIRLKLTYSESEADSKCILTIMLYIKRKHVQIPVKSKKKFVENALILFTFMTITQKLCELKGLFLL